MTHHITTTLATQSTDMMCLGLNGLNLLCVLQHWILRCFASIHLVVMYLAVLTWLPGSPSLLHPSVTQKVMEALGTWHPHVVKSMLPVLLALVVVSPLKADGRLLIEHMAQVTDRINSKSFCDFANALHVSKW